VAGDGKQYRPGKFIQTTLGDGTGKFTKVPTDLQDPNNFWWLIAGDFNGDGSLDIAGCYNLTNQTGIFIGKGDGSFKGPILYDITQVGSFPPSLVISIPTADPTYWCPTIHTFIWKYFWETVMEHFSRGRLLTCRKMIRASQGWLLGLQR
jgi:hypothetical protein